MPKNEHYIGTLLIAFFDYYNRFNFARKAISVNKGQTFPRLNHVHILDFWYFRKILPKNTARFKVFIEEPFDLQNTARCVTSDINWEIIKETFARAARTICTNGNAPDLRKLI